MGSAFKNLPLRFNKAFHDTFVHKYAQEGTRKAMIQRHCLIDCGRSDKFMKMNTKHNENHIDHGLLVKLQRV